MVPGEIEHEIVVDAPPERVWAILTEAEHIRQWFAFDGATIDPRPGGELVMQWEEHGVFHSRIEIFEPPHCFAFRGAFRPDEMPAPGNATLVTFTLTPEGAGTRVRVVESGFRELAISEAEKTAFVEGNIQGWNGAFTRLQDYLLKQPA